MTPEATLTLDDAVTDTLVNYSHRALQRSRFFSALKTGDVSMPLFKHVVGQYRLLRDRFHTWFGLCIFKSGSCEDENVKGAVLALAEHICIEMRDGHDVLFREFLGQLGMTQQEFVGTTRGEVTRRYDESFRQRFGLETDNFFDAVAALSSREIFHSIRNAYVLEHFLGPRGLGESEWWTLHVTLELDHFKAAVQPILQRARGDGAAVTSLVALVKQEIDRHVQYWDELFEEAKAAVGT